jgi:hypothetical protein
MLLLLLALACAAAAAEVLSPDLGVYGGTVCAYAACAAAARMNASCALVEPLAHLGGMTTGGLSGVDLRMPLGGIAREIFGAAPFPNFEPHVLNATLQRLLAAAGPGRVDVRAGAGGIARVDRDGPRVAAVHFDAGLELRARYYLDCSYDGDLLRLSNTSFALGHEAQGEYNETLAGANGGAPWAAGALRGVSPWADAANTSLLPTVAHLPPGGLPSGADGLVQAYNFRLCLTNNASNRLPLAPPAGYTPQATEVLRRWCLANAPALRNASSVLQLFLVRHLGSAKVDVNQGAMPGAADQPFLQDAYPLASWGARRGIAGAHEWWTRAVWEFLRSDAAVPGALRAEAATWGLPADEFQATAGFPPQLYVRESIRLRGEVVLAQRDVLGARARASPASVGLSQWLVDVHAGARYALPPALTGRGWEVAEAGGVNTLRSAWQVTEVPLGALLPRRSEMQNLLVPVCASFTHVAFATYRLEPQYAVFGHSAAVAAVLALRSGGGGAVQDVDVPALQAELERQGQLLRAPPPEDAPLALAACSAPPAPPPPAQAWAYAPGDGSLRLARGGGACASVWGFSNASGARVVAAACHPGQGQPRNQAFDLVAGSGGGGGEGGGGSGGGSGGGVYVRSRMSGLCVGAGGGALGALLTQGACSGPGALWLPPASAPGAGAWQLAAQAGGALCVAAEAEAEGGGG